MSDRIDNQGLEDFFHQHLDQYEDEPGSDFWGKLEGQIPPPPRKKRRVLLWWWLGAASLALLLNGLYFHQQKMNELEEKLKQQQADIQSLQAEKSIEKQVTNETTAVISEQSPSTPNQKTLATSTEKKSPQQPKVIQQRESVQEPLENRGEQFDFTSANTLISNDTTAALPVEQQNFNQQPLVKTDDIVEPNSATIFSPLAAKIILVNFDKMETLPAIPTVPELGETKFNPSLTVTVFYEKWLWIDKQIRNNDGLSVQNTLHPIQLQGATPGIKLGFRFRPHWQLETGIGRSHIQMQQTGSTQVYFREEGAELSTDNILYNDYEFGVSGVWGRAEYSASIGVRLKDNPLNNPMVEDPLKIVVQEENTLNYLYIPLHLQYHGGQKKWQWSVGTGLDMYRLWNKNASYQLSGTFWEEDRLVFREFSVRQPSGSPQFLDAFNSEDTFRGSPATTFRNYFMGMRLMAGGHYAIGKRWGLEVQGFFHHGLYNLQKDYQLRYAGMNIGCTYRLK